MLEISVACRHLPLKDTFSRSDPVCVLYSEAGDGKWIEMGRTEQLDNTHAPKWVTKFKIDDHAAGMKLKFAVYDWDKKKSTDVKKQDFLVELITTVGEIASAPRMELARHLGKNHKAEMIINAEKLDSDAKKVPVNLTFAAKDLKKMDKMSKSDPYYVLCRKTPQGNADVAVYRSEVIDNKVDVVWHKMKTDSAFICNGDWHRPLTVIVLDKDKNKSELIGKAKTSLAELFDAWKDGRKLKWELRDDKNEKTGELYVKEWGFE